MFKRKGGGGQRLFEQCLKNCTGTEASLSKKRRTVALTIEVASAVNRRGLARAGSWLMTEGQLVSAH